MQRSIPFEFFANKRHGTPGVVVLNAAGFRRAQRAITGWPGYAPTPLVAAPAVAARAGVASVYVKDESGRFGLGAFKALGGAYAVGEAVAAERARHPRAAVTVCCATDGNHGRAVAWGARLAGAECVVFVHPGVPPGRVAAIRAEGAAVAEVPGTYDDAVRAIAARAVQEGWIVVSDTSYPGYTEIPREVMQGYRVMADEALTQMRAASPAPPTHVFIQAGVGGVAAAVAAQCRALLGGTGAGEGMPRLVVVEPVSAAPLLRSAQAGRVVAVEGAMETVMGCLACGEPSLLAWQELERSADAFVAVGDGAAVDAMRTLAAAGVVSGPSGAAGLAGLLAVAGDGAARAALELGAESRVLLFSTEGAVDPAEYRALVGDGSPAEDGALAEDGAPAG